MYLLHLLTANEYTTSYPNKMTVKVKPFGYIT